MPGTVCFGLVFTRQTEDSMEDNRSLSTTGPILVCSGSKKIRSTYIHKSFTSNLPYIKQMS